MARKRILVFASGSAKNGGSGLQELIESSKTNVLQADIVAVISHHESGGVQQRATQLGVPFMHMHSPWNKQAYQKCVRMHKPDLVCLSGWLKLVSGLDPLTTINIHPGPLPRFGGKGMYGHHVHEAVVKAYKKGEIKHTAVTMHFVTEKYDMGPVFFSFPVLIRDGDDAKSLAIRVNKIEQAWQSHITNLVVTNQICWDGSDPRSLLFPAILSNSGLL